MQIVKLVKPPREVVFLMAVGLVDLVTTVVLYCFGFVEEINPLMRPIIEKSPVLFTFIKLATLVAAYFVMIWYTKVDEKFVRRVAWLGGWTYVVVWILCTSLGALLI